MAGTLAPGQIEQLWIRAGGDPKAAPLMASIAMAESGGNPAALNTNANTHDYSAGLWQVNYFGNLAPDRTARYGPVSSLYGGSYQAALNNARAAVSLYDHGKGLGNWQGDRAYSAYMAGGPAALKPFLGNAGTPGAPLSPKARVLAQVGTSGAGLSPSGGLSPAMAMLAQSMSTGGGNAGSLGLLAFAAQRQQAQAAQNVFGGGGARTSGPTSETNFTSDPNHAGGFLPKGQAFTYDRHDQGRDIQTQVGSPILAPGAGYVVRIGNDPGGGGAHFGPSYPIVHFTSGPYAGKTVYIGHTRAALQPGARFAPGEVLSHTQASGPWNGGAPSGWAEIGFAPGGTPGAVGQQAPF